MKAHVGSFEPAVGDRQRHGDVVGLVRPLRRVPESLARSADSYLLVYRMPAVRGGSAIATAMLFVPRGSVPRSGFPLVAFCHGTVGWSARWAPSLCVENASHPKMGAHWELALPMADLLEAGHVVVAPDYEGLGDTSLGVPATGHPYYCSRSEGRSIGFAAVATKRALGERVSNTWAAVGHSQGGKAVLAAAETLKEIIDEEPSLTFKGAVAIAPSTNIRLKMIERWGRVQAASAAYNPDGGIFYLGALNAYSILYVRALISAGYDIDPQLMFGERALRAYAERSDLDHYSLILEMTDDAARYIYCDVESGNVFNRAEAYPGVRIEGINSARFKDAMEENEAGRIYLPGEFLVIQGTTDLWTPESWCRELINTMLSQGTSVRYSIQTGADHYGVLQSPAARSLVQMHLGHLFRDRREM